MKKSGVTTVHEAYSFVCMRCGYGWERAYEIEHHTNAEGLPFLLYFSEGQRVSSPFSRLSCDNCGSNVVRILRPGRVSEIADATRNAKIKVSGRHHRRPR